MLKLLDYGNLNPFSEIIGRPRYLAWPVNVYRVTLPRGSHDGNDLNPFERVILKILDALGVMEDRALADETRIPLDLVKSILLRLRDKGFIDEYQSIIKQDYDNIEDEQKEAPIFVTALIFRELVTGNLLPFMHFLDEGNPLQKREVKNLRMISANREHERCVPVPRDVISVWRAMRKRSKTFGKNEKIPAVQQITIVPQPEMNYLYCPIAIQKSDGEFRIADPFGNGFSLVLESSFEKLLEQEDKQAEWLNKWKESLRNRSPSKLDENPKEPFDNETNWQRYPKLLANLRPSQNNSFRSIAKIHASFEWALFYACCRRPFDSVIARLNFSAQAEHPALLAVAAKNVGLLPPKQGFKPIREGKILDFQNEKADLGTVLAIIIFQAESDELHPLRRIAYTHPDLFGRLLDVKKKRDEKGHGKGKADAPANELPDDSFMREIVNALLPDIVFSNTVAAGLSQDVRADSLLDARASVQSEFGFKAFNLLGANLQDRLIHAERFWLDSQDGDDASAFANDLYASLQAKFGQKLFDKLPPDIMDSEFICAAQKKTQENSLGELSECLCTVKLLGIRDSLQGKDSTLGACVVAFLLMSDEETLQSIASSQPSFIDDITNVIVSRKHGNEPLPLPKLDIAKLRKASYKTMKTLIEV